jgi:ATP synthase protein I
VIGLFVGLKLDAWFGTAPWLTALFLLIGIIAGFRNLFVYVKRSQDDLDAQNKDEKK